MAKASNIAIKSLRFSLGLFFLAGVSPVAALAQTPVTAGTLQQQIERERENNLPPPGSAVLGAAPTVPQVPEAGGLRITVKKFRFEGNTLLSDQDLAPVVAPYLNHPISFADLQNAAARVGEAYRAKGRIVRAFLPKQDIRDGVVTIEIIEGKFGKTRIDGDANTRIPADRIENMVAAQQPAGAPIDTKQIDRALLLIDDLPGVAVSGRLQQGEKPGETDLVVKPTGEPLVTGIGAVDNEGARETGYERAYADIQLLSPLRMGDLSSAYLLYSEGLHYARLEETVPVGDGGWRIGFNGSAMNYRILPSAFDALDGKGDSESVGLQASYPVIRVRQDNLYWDINYDHRFFNNDANHITASRYQIDESAMALRGNLLDQLSGGGSNGARLGVTLGNLRLGTLDSGEDPAVGGGFSKLFFSANRLQTVTPDVSLYAALSGQYSPQRRLDSSEMLYLGGPDGVRAYPVDEGSGVSGGLLTIEPRWRFAPGWQASTFFDQGYVHNGGDIKSYSLRGAGLALAWQSESGFDLRATWAHRLGDNPNPTANGDDQDGSLIKDRFWLTLSKQF